MTVIIVNALVTSGCIFPIEVTQNDDGCKAGWEHLLGRGLTPIEAIADVSRQIEFWLREKK